MLFYFKQAKEHFHQETLISQSKILEKLLVGTLQTYELVKFQTFAWLMFAFHSFAMCWNKLVQLQGKIHRFSHLPDKRVIKTQAEWLHIFLQWLTTNTAATITDLFSVKRGTSFPACLGYLNMRETAHHKAMVSTQECLPHGMRADADILELTANRSWAVQSSLDSPPRSRSHTLGFALCCNSVNYPCLSGWGSSIE